MKKLLMIVLVVLFAAPVLAGKKSEYQKIQALGKEFAAEQAKIVAKDPKAFDQLLVLIRKYRIKFEKLQNNASTDDGRALAVNRIKNLDWIAKCYREMRGGGKSKVGNVLISSFGDKGKSTGGLSRGRTSARSGRARTGYSTSFRKRLCSVLEKYSRARYLILEPDEPDYGKFAKLAEGTLKKLKRLRSRARSASDRALLKSHIAGLGKDLACAKKEQEANK